MKTDQPVEERPAQALGSEMLPDELGGNAVAAATVPPHRRRPIALYLAIAWIVFIVLSAVLAGVLPIPGEGEAVGPARFPPFEKFSDGLALGTDTFGRSNLARAIYGARNSLLIAIVASVIGLIVGGFIGLASGYLRGWTDRVSSFGVDTMLSFPPLILLLTIGAVLGPKPSTVLIGLALLVIPTFVRLERAAALSWSQRPFVLAARSYGTSDLRIALRHVLPNSMLTLISFAPTVIAGLIVAEGALSFLGLGIPSPSASWGVMIAEGRSALRTQPSVVFVPAAFVFLSVISFNVVGENLRRRIESRDRS